MSMALHRLSSVTIGVPNIAMVSGFCESFGLVCVGEGRFATRGGEQLRFQHAPYRRLQAIELGVDHADDLAAIGSRLQTAGHSVAGSPGSPTEISVDEVHAGVRVTVN
jgi:hypothetical protein